MNYITNRLAADIADKGSLMENFVFTELVKKDVEIKFWRTGGGAEVDFVVDGIPIEVKSTPLRKDSLSRSFISYLNTYEPKTGYFINADYYGDREFGGREVKFYPLWAVPLLVKQFLL